MLHGHSTFSESAVCAHDYVLLDAGKYRGRFYRVLHELDLVTGPGVPKRQGEHGKGAVSRAEAKSTPRCDVSARKELASLKQQLEDNKEARR